MNNRRWLTSVRVLGDMLIALMAYYAAFWLRMNVEIPFTEKLLPRPTFTRLPHFWWVVVGAQALALYFAGLYDEDRIRRQSSLRAPLAAVIMTTLFLIAFYFFIDIRFPRTVFLVFFLLDFPLLIGWEWLTHKFRTPSRRQRTVFVGVNRTSADLLREIQRRPWLGLDVVGFVREQAVPAMAGLGAPPEEPADTGDLPVLGSREDIARIVQENDIDQIILTPSTNWQDELIDQLGELGQQNSGEMRRTQVMLVPSPHEILIAKPRQSQVHDIPLIPFLREPLSTVERMLKRVIDVTGALLLGILVLPVCLFAALGIKATSPGPLFYRQVRVGRNGKLFSIIKFRTMVTDAEKLTGAVLAQKNDPRIFPLGRVLRKTRIDELPQLLNILSGDMSFVGPRPERPEFVSQFRKEIPGYAERLRVKPGVTGLAQVNGYYETTAENKLKYDLTYIYNYSFLLDIKLLLATVKVVLTARGT